MNIIDPRLRNSSASMLTNAGYQSTISESFRNMYQYKINDEFEKTSQVFDIDEETYLGSNLWEVVRVRIVHIISSSTSTKRGDDYKEIIFPDMDHARSIGYRYRFDDNIWMGISTDNYKYVTASIVLRRCNNVLKWIDSNGVLQIEPCVLDYDYSMTNLQQEAHLIVPDGTLNVYVQNNSLTKTLYINQRFILGGQAYILKSNKNWDNLKTYDSTSSTIFQYKFEKVAENPLTDDLINNIADAYINTYSLTIDQTPFSQSVGYTNTLSATLKLNNQIVSEPLSWISATPTLASIDINTGVFNLLSSGTVNFKVYMTNNTSVSANIQVTISAPSNVYSVIFTPLNNVLKQGLSQIYTATLLKDGIVQSDTFSFAGSNVPLNYYNLTILDGNTFQLSNLQEYTSNPLTITANTGTHSGNINISLIGMW